MPPRERFDAADDPPCQNCALLTGQVLRLTRLLHDIENLAATQHWKIPGPPDEASGLREIDVRPPAT